MKEYLPRKLGGIFSLIRPFTLLAPAIGGASAAIMASASVNFQNFSFRDLVYGVGTLVIVVAASNCLNAAYDSNIDRINKPYRPVPSGIVTEDEARIIAYLLYIFTAWRAATMFNPIFGILIVSLIFITITYSAPPIRLKKRLWLSNISIAFARGLIGFLAAWSIFGSIYDPTPWVIGTILFVYLLGAVTTKDFTDISGDRQFNIRTIPVVYGIKKATYFTAPFFIIPFIFIPFGVLMNWLIEEANYLVILVPWGVYMLYLLKSSTIKQDTNLENSPVWKHMYLMLIAFQIGFCIIYVLSENSIFVL